MGSGEREQPTRHPTVGSSLCSLIVRPPESEGGGGGTAGNDYEPGEVRREKNNYGNAYNDKKSNHNRHHQHHNSKSNGNHNYNDLSPIYSVSPRYSRSPLRSRPQNRFPDKFQGYGNGIRAHSSASPLRHRMRVGSVSPIRQRKADHRYGSDFEHPSAPDHGPGFRGGRGPGRFREFSPPLYGRGRVAKPFGRGFASFDGPRREPSPFDDEDESIGRNNPNVSPREGDWICSEPSCGNLNFARRAYCNNCNKLRFGPRGGPSGSPRRNYLRPLSPPSRRLPGPPMERGRGRGMNGYGSPRSWGGGGPRDAPRGWARDDPRELKMGPPPFRHEERFPDPHLRRERPDYPEDGYRGRGKFVRSIPPEWGQRGRGKGEFFHEGRFHDGNDRRPPSPPPPPLSPPQRGMWVHDRRDRSRSPMRGGPRDYHGEPFMGRGRAYRRGMRGRGGRMRGGY